jgi:hypothetical protein
MTMRFMTLQLITFEKQTQDLGSLTISLKFIITIVFIPIRGGHRKLSRSIVKKS